MHALPSPRAIEEPSTAQVAERGQLLAERDALAAVRLSLGRSLPFPWHSHCPLVDPFTAFHCISLAFSLHCIGRRTGFGELGVGRRASFAEGGSFAYCRHSRRSRP